MKKHHLKMILSFLLAAGLTACSGGGASVPNMRTQSSLQSEPHNTASRGISSLNTATVTYTAINAGGGASGNWAADEDFNGGSIVSVKTAVDTRLVSNPAPQNVYQSQRFGTNLIYTVPNLTPNAIYNVRLHFAETYFRSAGQRIFNVAMNGKQEVANLDVFQVAGGANVAIAKSFSGAADATGKLVVQLTSTVNNASLAGIEITAATATPTPAPTATPVGVTTAVNAGGAASGHWIADTGFSGGWVTSVSNAVTTNLVSNPAPQAVYQTQRVGTNFSYVVANLTPSAPYTVRLDLVETFFSSKGQRIFGVKSNGVQVLSNFDIFQAAGAANAAIAMPFTSNADASGKILLTFTSSVNNASVSGIEITAGASVATPTPSPTSTPSASPSPKPTPTAIGTAWPAAGWVPYTAAGPMTAVVAPNPTYTAGSANMINAMWSGRSSDPGRLQAYSGPAPPDGNDYSQPLYFGHAGDPLYTITCYDYGGRCPASGVSVHIPKGAYPAGGTDHHISIRDLATGKDVMLWLAPIPNGSGGAYSVGWGTTTDSNGNGINAVGGTASGISSLWALRATDLIHDTINHAILIQINGESPDGYVYPAVGWDNGFFHADPWPKVGAHFWLDVAPPYASGCPQSAVSYLTALNKYGAFFADNGGISSPIGAILEGDISYTYNGGASVWGPLMQSLGGNLVGTSNLPISNCGINLQLHMHVLNPPA